MGEAVKGRVYLVGTGIGDPDFLTVRADRILRTVDTVVHDRSVSEAILSLIPKRTERIVADDPDEAESQALLALTSQARKGRSVACLKGGDAFAFGECTPLARLLAESAIPFEIVPAVNLPAGWGARTGTPLTHRGAATGICFIRLDAGGIEPDWKRMIDPQTTIALYGNMELAAESLERLIEAGMPPATPAAVLRERDGKGVLTRSDAGALAKAMDGTSSADVRVVYIGKVVPVGERLSATMLDQEAG